ncbi:hypothetical protein Dsin_018374 [Dipteronia sinensis]|uniref:Uncharacterized protein n=1 Tax=Dipteronia sinensis TaxID=43782 RepID=A0AAE0E1V5_9ROSI|nr:hypothetical protein Dsin_018374 [Dipteronia sinensis]
MGRTVEHWFHPNHEQFILRRRDLTLIFLSKKSMRLTSSVANRTSYLIEEHESQAILPNHIEQKDHRDFSFNRNLRLYYQITLSRKIITIFLSIKDLRLYYQITLSRKVVTIFLSILYYQITLSM